jgi:putative transposase
MIKQISRGLFQIIIIANGEKKFLTRVNQDILFNYIHSVLFKKHCTPIAINGAGNHIHILTNVSPDNALNQIVKEIQINTTDFLRREKSVFPEFAGWSLNYVALSFGQNQQKELVEFINGQFNYHKNQTLSEELEYLIGEPENANA